MWIRSRGEKKNLETGNVLGEQFSSSSFFKRNPCGVQFVSSLYRRLEEEKRRRQVEVLGARE